MPKKIFELAKEMGTGPLDLVEDLKSKGFSVRNHMTNLSDDDLAKIEELYKAKAVTTVKKKKKVVRKKVAKKKVSTVKSAKKEEAPKEAALAAKSTKAVDKSVTKKKTLIRKKLSVSKATESSVTEGVSAEGIEGRLDVGTSVQQSEGVNAGLEEKTPQSGVAASEESVSTTDVPKVGKENRLNLGLRVVSRPEKALEAIKEQPIEEVEKIKGDGKEYYKEKVHRFTPIYTPPAEAKEEKEEKDEKTGARPGPAKTSEQTAADQSAASDKGKAVESGDSKKRLGGLATMMSGKKVTINKAQALIQSRADSELKSYGALGSLGRPLYTQVKRKKIFHGMGDKTKITEIKESKRVITLYKGAYLEELAKKLNVKFDDLVNKALEMNLLIRPDDYVGVKLAAEIAALYQYRVENRAFDEDKVLGREKLDEDEKSKLPLRDPIITIMGHVDHGKTTLLDYIRDAKVADGEAGGITQHIGAYSVKVKNKNLTFLDTPGHAAFASMRQRGAYVTDIVVLVVAADDGMMPQTRESIRFCQNANVPIIVAINKMDKEVANPDRVKSDLAEAGINPEEWGGDTIFVPISALKGDGVDGLLESIYLLAEMQELRADPKGKAEGVVIESKIEAGRGPVATILIQKGTLKKGESIVVGESFGRARGMMNHLGAMLPKAGPSTPVQILGLDNPPAPGDMLNVVKSEREAKKIVQNRINERKVLEVTETGPSVSLEDFFSMDAADGTDKKELNLIVRSDVQGSFEAIKEALVALGNKEVSVKVIGGGVGPINDSDINLAESAGAVVVGFNMRPLTTARKLSEDLKVDVKTYSVIYELINDITLALEGLLDPEFEEKFIGRAEVKDTFVIPKIGTIAGSMVIDGKIMEGCHIRLLRNGKIMFDGKMSSLKRFKDDVKEVKNGFECGIGLESYNDIKVSDLFEAYMMVERKRKLEDVEKEEGGAASSKSPDLSSPLSI
ncbi:translation initiation factor IF-2 [Bacteriovoracales bacterium]|nr:translation initiation factor IF-2 [Bacteriovoracales bacterium]